MPKALSLPLLPNSSFSSELPTLQLALDSTSLGALKKCPWYYYLTIVLGFEPKSQSAHLTWGLLMHGGRERYYHAKSQGLEHSDALDAALTWGLTETWDREAERAWTSDIPEKSRFTFLRALVWYLDQYGPNDTLRTLHRADGKPMVELSFSFDSGLTADSTGEAFLLCGHIDRVVEFNNLPYVDDLKSTGRSLDPGFFRQFNPHGQFSLYLFATQVALAVPAQALIVDAVQTLVTGTRFERALVSRTSEQLDEWRRDLSFRVQELESYALADNWPMNEESCGNYGGCRMRDICAKSPGARLEWLERGFQRRVWDPLERRGDI